MFIKENRNRSGSISIQVIEKVKGRNKVFYSAGAGECKEEIEHKATFEAFFEQANLNPNANLIKGVICGYRIEEIETTLTKHVRYLDKLVDELAKGRKMEKILRTV